MRYRALALILTLVFAFATAADALVLCAPKKGVGVLKVRDACKKKETTVDPSAVGLVGPQGPEGPEGPEGPMGEAGEPGATGQQGASGPLADYEIVESTQTVFVDNSGSPSGLSEVVTLACPEGKHVVGGGVSIADTDKGAQRDIRVAMSRPTAGGTSWEAQLFNANVSFGLNADLKLRVICATTDTPIVPIP